MSPAAFNRPRFHIDDFSHVCAKAVITGQVRGLLVLYGLSPKLANVALVMQALQ